MSDEDLYTPDGRRVTPITASQRTRAGDYISSAPLALARMEEYVTFLVTRGVKAQTVAALHDIIEGNTQRMDPHPNEIVFLASIVMAQLQKGGLPIVSAIRKMKEDKPANGGLWTPH